MKYLAVLRDRFGPTFTISCFLDTLYLVQEIVHFEILRSICRVTIHQALVSNDV